MTRYGVVVALFLWLVPVASAHGQDSPQLARALERAEQYYIAIGPKPAPTAKWLAGDRLAYSDAAKAPWEIIEASTARVVESDASDAAVGGPGLSATAALPRWMVPTASTSPAWTVRSDNT